MFSLFEWQKPKAPHYYCQSFLILFFYSYHAICGKVAELICLHKKYIQKKLCYNFFILGLYLLIILTNA